MSSDYVCTLSEDGEMMQKPHGTEFAGKKWPLILVTFADKEIGEGKEEKEKEKTDLEGTVSSLLSDSQFFLF
jgi:hypothetical protein